MNNPVIDLWFKIIDGSETWFAKISYLNFTVYQIGFTFEDLQKNIKLVCNKYE